MSLVDRARAVAERVESRVPANPSLDITLPRHLIITTITTLREVADQAGSDAGDSTEATALLVAHQLRMRQVAARLKELADTQQGEHAEVLRGLAEELRPW